MGIYSRDYYRNSSSSGGWGLDRLTPGVKFLILVNVAVFLLQLIVVREPKPEAPQVSQFDDPDVQRLITRIEEGELEALETLRKRHPEAYWQFMESEYDDHLYDPYLKVSVVQEWFELDTNKVVREGQVWRVLTSAFCHDRYGIWHIVFNMLLLYWFGSTLESMYGRREFLLFYLTAAVIASLAFIALDLYTGSSIPAIGASGAVMAVMMLYTMHYPRQVIFLCWILPVEMRWIMAFYLIFDLHPVILALSGDRLYTGVAHAAHLGGLFFGFLYFRYQWRLETMLDCLAWRRRVSRPRPQLRLVTEEPPPPRHEMERVDELLQKILDLGQDGLSAEELDFLRNASTRLKKRE